VSAQLSAASQVVSTRAPVLQAVPRPVRRGPFARDALLRRLLALADVEAAAAAAAALALAGAGAGPAATAFATVPLWIFCAKLYGLYDRDHRMLRHLTVDELPTLLVWALTCVSAILFVAQVILGEAVGAVPTVWAFAAALATAVFARALARYAWRRLTPPERAVIVGSGQVAAMIRRKLELFDDIHVEVVADVPHTEPDRMRLAGRVDRIILASPSIDEALIAHLVARCRRRRMKLSVVPPARGMFGTAVQLRHIADLPVIE
jgi:FlaA1/EpsC-like NDP-sugar epimerase